MEDENNKPKLKLSIEGFDPLGLKSLGEISKEAVEFGLDGAKEFLKLTCKPLLEEFGLLARDQFTNWRLSNIIKMLEKAKGKLRYDPEKEKLIIDPRVAFQIVEHASTISNETLQDMWAGLFASSCEKYEEDENITFVDILKRLTSSQVKLINYLCRNSQKDIDVINLPNSKEAGIVSSGPVQIGYDDLPFIMETNSRVKVDTEFSTLESIGLIQRRVGSVAWPLIDLVKSLIPTGTYPTLMAIRLYIKCQGSTDTPYNYYLPEIADHYYGFIKDFVKVDKETALEQIYQIARFGKTFANEVELSSDSLILKNHDWFYLTEDELTERLRPYLVYRHMANIGKVYSIEVDKKNIGIFSYKDGFIKT